MAIQAMLAMRQDIEDRFAGEIGRRADIGRTVLGQLNTASLMFSGDNAHENY